MNQPVRPVYWTVDEIAALLRVSRMSVYRLVEREELRGLRVGRSIRIPQRALDEYMRAANTVAFERPA